MSPQELAKLNEQLSLVLKELGGAIRSRFAGRSEEQEPGRPKTDFPEPGAKSRLSAVVGFVVEKLLLLIRRLLGTG